MADFANSIFEVFARLQSEYGFVPAGSGQRSASLVRALRDDVVVYLFVRDGRAGDSSLVISLWVAPPDSPDDGLDNLMVGFKLHIASAYDVDDEFFELAQRRIIALLPYLGALAEPVRNELANPAFRTLRYRVYMLERAVYETLLTIAAAEPTGSVAVLFEMYRAFASGGSSVEKLEEARRLVAAKILSEKRLSPEALEFYGNDADLLVDGISSKMYVHALVERSESLLVQRHNASGSSWVPQQVASG